MKNKLSTSAPVFSSAVATPETLTPKILKIYTASRKEYQRAFPFEGFLQVCDYYHLDFEKIDDYCLLVDTSLYLAKEFEFAKKKFNNELNLIEYLAIQSVVYEYLEADYFEAHFEEFVDIKAKRKISEYLEYDNTNILEYIRRIAHRDCPDQMRPWVYLWQ